MHCQILARNIFLILTIVLLWTLLMLSGCSGGPSPAPPVSPASLTGIIVQPDATDLKVGESKYINSVTASYSDSSTASIPLGNCTYSSYNPSCATVIPNGLITGISAGTTVILVTYTEGTISKTDTVEVTVMQNEIVYRAYCVGVGDYIYFPDIYGNTDLPGPPYDVNRMCYTLNKCRFGPSNTEFSEIWYTTDWSSTKLNILQGIASIFSEADYNDVSYFYFTGHGVWVNNISYLCPTEANYYAPMSTYISVDELETALSAIPGTKVVLLDSCHSGGFIGKGAGEIQISKEEELDSFNNEIINVFSQAESKGLLTTNQYKVLTSCHYYQECMELAPATPGDFDPFGVFTMALCDGCGYYGSYPADANLDTRVSLQEAYLYIKNWVAELDAQIPYIDITQDVQVYPYNSTFTIAEY
ncbi:MAG: caspase family protein [Atribacterota bacterium]